MLSPHYKTGLVSRNIASPFGQIDTRFLVWDQVLELAVPDAVMLEMATTPERVRTSPGTLTSAQLCTLAEDLVGEVYMIAMFSPQDASDLTPERYEICRERQ